MCSNLKDEDFTVRGAQVKEQGDTSTLHSKFNRYLIRLSNCTICQQVCDVNPLLCNHCIDHLNVLPLEKLNGDLLNWPAIDKCFNKRSFDQLIAISLYQPPLSYWLAQLKYHRQNQLAELLGYIFCHYCEPTFLSSVDQVIAVPLHIRKWQLRGFNQARLLAAYIARHYAVSLNESILFRKKHTSAQVGKSGKARRTNLNNAFALTSDLPLNNQHILLVDDVITTGTTVNQISQLLKQAGVKQVTVATMCLSI